jgi:uncharacterized RDD family membrane protein YckC
MEPEMTDGGPLWPERPKLPDGPAPGFAYARLLPRAAATFIDYLVCVAVAGIPITLLGAGERTASPFLASVANVIVIVAFFGVFGVTAAIWNGQTIGGRILGIRIVNRNDGSAIGWDRALVRPIGVFLTVALWFLSLIVLILSKDKRTPADLLTGTVVIKTAVVPASVEPGQTEPAPLAPAQAAVAVDAPAGDGAVPLPWER